jgi:hypothetical protein
MQMKLTEEEEKYLEELSEPKWIKGHSLFWKMCDFGICFKVYLSSLNTMLSTRRQNMRGRFPGGLTTWPFYPARLVTFCFLTRFSASWNLLFAYLRKFNSQKRINSHSKIQFHLSVPHLFGSFAQVDSDTRTRLCTREFRRKHSTTPIRMSQRSSNIPQFIYSAVHSISQRMGKLQEFWPSSGIRLSVCRMSTPCVDHQQQPNWKHFLTSGEI